MIDQDALRYLVAAAALLDVPLGNLYRKRGRANDVRLLAAAAWLMAGVRYKQVDAIYHPLGTYANRKAALRAYAGSHKDMVWRGVCAAQVIKPEQAAYLWQAANKEGRR